jgi:hypothetical protein
MPRGSKKVTYINWLSKASHLKIISQFKFRISSLFFVTGECQQAMDLPTHNQPSEDITEKKSRQVEMRQGKDKVRFLSVRNNTGASSATANI